MTAIEFADYCRRIRECNNPLPWRASGQELDRDYPTGRESDALVLMATLKLSRCSVS